MKKLIAMAALSIAACGPPPDKDPASTNNDGTNTTGDEFEYDGYATPGTDDVKLVVVEQDWAKDPDSQEGICTDFSSCGYRMWVTLPAALIVEGAEVEVGDDVTADVNVLNCNNTVYDRAVTGVLTFTEVTDTHVAIEWDFTEFDLSGGGSSDEPESGSAVLKLCAPL